MKTVLITVTMVLILGGCQNFAAEIYKSPQGVIYAVEHVAGVKPDELPQNSDFKMADGNLTKYAETACVLDVSANTAPDRCDIYVQSDKAGTLIGYAVVTEGKAGVSFQTITTLNEQKEPGGESCYVGGKIYGNEADYQKAVTNAGRNFEGRSMYSAWEKEPGNFLFSEVGPEDQTDANPNSALGVWYVSKIGDKMRISQGRWNYCYLDKSVSVDDVFYRAISLVKAEVSGTLRN